MALMTGVRRINGRRFCATWAGMGLCAILLAACSGCGVDWSGLLDNTTGPTDATVADLAGTWTGTLTVDNQSSVYTFTVDSAGNFSTWNDIDGTVTTTSNGKVTFTYVVAEYSNTFTLHGTMSADKTKIVMTTYSWTGTSSGSAAFAGVLTKSGSSDDDDGDYLLTDLVGTWSGMVTENGKPTNYQFIVNASGAFATTDGLSGTAAISTTGTVLFSYASGGYAGTFQGTMDSGKTKITMSKHTWTGTDNGTATVTGTLAKS